MRGRAACLAAVVVATTAAAAPAVYRTGPPPAHTGGFGEPHCGECHFDAPVNDPGGSLDVRAPASYRTGKTYPLVVVLRDPELKTAGFQLATRFADGDQAGTQAGSLRGPDGSTQTVTGDAGVAYVTHTESGVETEEPGMARWELEWMAPDTVAPVAVHVTANAANDDRSEFGDRVYLSCVVIGRDAPRPSCD